MEWDSDGSTLNSWADPNHGIYANSPEKCFVYKSDEMDDKDCNAEFNYICEFKCQLPLSYIYETSVDKYYKPVKTKVPWHSARDACSSEGSILVELRTSAEYQAILPIYGMSFIRVMRSFN